MDPSFVVIVVQDSHFCLFCQIFSAFFVFSISLYTPTSWRSLTSWHFQDFRFFGFGSLFVYLGQQLLRFLSSPLFQPSIFDLFKFLCKLALSGCNSCYLGGAPLRSDRMQLQNFDTLRIGAPHIFWRRHLLLE